MTTRSEERTTPVSLEVGLAGRSNAFGFLRLLLSSLVIVDHAFPLGGYGADPMWSLTRGQASFGSLAVLGFFAISGYLIAKSASRLDLLQYFWHRALRIFPAYWMALIVGALVVGPFVWWQTGNSLAVYLNRDITGPINYVLGNADLSINTYGIHNIFVATPYGQEVGASVLNGSIWTLIYEWICYVVVAVLALAGLMTRQRWTLVVLVTGIAALLLMETAAPGTLATFAPILADPQLLPLVFVFLLGSTFAAFRDSVPVDHRLGIFALVVVALTLNYGGFTVFGHLAGAYAILYLAAALPAAIKRIGAVNDYSYGIYVYGFLVQQTLAHFGVHTWGYVAYVVVALAVSWALAWASWHGLEKRALAIKSWGPGKGLTHWRGELLKARRLRQS